MENKTFLFWGKSAKHNKNAKIEINRKEDKYCAKTKHLIVLSHSPSSTLFNRVYQDAVCVIYCKMGKVIGYGKTSMPNRIKPPSNTRSTPSVKKKNGCTKCIWMHYILWIFYVQFRRVFCCRCWNIIMWKMRKIVYYFKIYKNLGIHFHLHSK